MQVPAPRSLALPLIAVGSLTATATAGDWDIEPLILVGDLVSGAGTVQTITDLAINDSGQWAIALNTDNPNTFANSFLVRDGETYYAEGQPVPGVPDTGLNTFGAVYIDGLGRLSSELFTFGLTIPGNAAVAHWNDIELFRTGFGAPMSYPDGALWAAFSELRLNTADQILLHATVDDVVGGQFIEGIHLMNLDSAGGQQIDIRLSASGDQINLSSGAVETIESIVDGPHSKALSENGIAMYLVNATGPAATEMNALVNGTPVAQEGGDSGVDGRLWKDLSFAPLDINSAAQWVIKGRLTGDLASEHVIVRQGQKLVQSGDPVPGVPGETIFNFSQTAPLFIDEQGNVMWIGSWLSGGLSYGLFRNLEPLVIEGVTQVDGATVSSIYAFQDGFELSPDGTRFLFRAQLDDGREGVFRGTLSGAVETLPGCTGNPLTLTAGAAPTLGAPLDFTLGGSPFAADVPLVFLAASQIIPGNPCGIPIPGSGELLIAVTPFPIEVPLAPGNPATGSVNVPSTPALAGVELFAQGAVISLDGGLDLLRLSNGLRLCLGV